MKKSELINLVREELKGYSPQIGQTKGLTTDTMTKILTKIAKGDDYGSKPSKVNKFKTDLSEQEEWPEEVPSRHGDIIFKLVKVMSDRAKYSLINAKTGKVWESGGRVFRSVEELKTSAEDTIMPQGGIQSSQF